MCNLRTVAINICGPCKASDVYNRPINFNYCILCQVLNAIIIFIIKPQKALILDVVELQR